MTSVSKCSAIRFQAEMHKKRMIGDYKLSIHCPYEVFVNSIKIGGSTLTTQQNSNSNSTANKNDSTKKKDPTTDTAYGDPVIASSPTINNDYKKATSTIAESTQNGST